MKKVFIISAVFLLVVLIFLGIYNFAFKKTAIETSKVTLPTTPEAVKNPVVEIKPEKIIVMSSGSVLGLVMDKKTDDVKYYDAQTGLVWKAGLNGKQQLTTTKVFGLINVLWSQDGNKVLTTTKKEGKTSFYMYDYITQKGTLLRDGLDTVVWDGLGTKIFYKYFDSATGNRTLNISNPDGTGWQKIADLSMRNVGIASVPSTSLVSFWNFPSAEEETQLRTVGLTGGESTMIFSGKYGGDYLWSPKGDKALVSALPTKDAKTIMLGLISIDGRYQDLNIPTFVSKCVWAKDGKTIFYALPGGIPMGSIMPNDYQDDKFNTADTFWKMDIVTGEKTRIIEASDINGKYDSTELILSTLEDTLYFKNKVDKKLYKLVL